MAERYRTVVQRACEELEDPQPREGRLPSAFELWWQRAQRAADALEYERAREFRDLMCEFLRVDRVYKTERLPGWELEPRVDEELAANPHYQDDEWASRREGEIFDAIGELCGIGPPPP